MGRDFAVCAALISFVFEFIVSARYFMEEKSRNVAGSLKDRADRAGALEERKAGKGTR